MKCINKCCRRMAAGWMALLLAFSLTGCKADALEDSFDVDRPGLGISTVAADSEISYFADDLCVVADNVEAIAADTQDALSACFFDLDSREVLYAKNVHERRYPASTTKVMTALVALKYGDLDAQATVSKEAITFQESGVTTAKLKEGDRLTIRQLLYALLLLSANDAANVIAEQVAGSTEEFVNLMNQEAQNLGATSTHFTNPHGLHDEEHYTTAYDLYLIFNSALSYDTFREILQTPSYETTYQSAGGESVDASWSSTNQFTVGEATVPEGVTAIGGKTGTTTAAMSCLVQLFEDSNGKEYVAIILGCKERAILYQEMQSFLSSLDN